MALCATEICCTVPCGIAAIVLDTMDGQVQPYISWSNVHADFSRVWQYPTVVWQSSPIMAAGVELTRWLYILCAIVSFGFFGLGEEARESYWYALRVTACAVRFLFGWVTRNSANRKGYRWGSLSLWLSKPRSWVDLVDVFPLCKPLPLCLVEF
jgi:pheromone a factor receptor